MIYELKPIYDGAKSFYNKATIEQIEDVEGYSIYTLTSYQTTVARVYTSRKKCEVYTIPTDTTLRHVKEFLNQQCLEATSKKQIMEDYGYENN